MFQTSSEEMSVCQDCLSDEFAGASPLAASEKALLEQGIEESSRRREARARRMNIDYTRGSAFDVSGKLRFGFALVLFLICQFVFLLGSSRDYDTALSLLSMDSQRIIAIIFCWPAAVLMLFVSRRHRFLTWTLSLIFFVIGWVSPEVWAYSTSDDVSDVASLNEVSNIRPQESDDLGIYKQVLTAKDLEVFSNQKKKMPNVGLLAVYLNDQDTRSRATIREALTRLLDAEYTKAYTRANGALYMVVNVPQEALARVERQLSRFGRVAYNNAKEGVYEVIYDADKANMVSKYSPSVLTTPTNSAFVTANISELRCVDPMRVRMAALALRGADVKALRDDVRNALVEVLADPWTREADTYTALMEALVAYSRSGDAKVIELCRAYFQSCEDQKLNIAPSVLDLLIRETPEEMMEPILRHWCEDAVVWGPYMAKLGDKAEPSLLKMLEETKNIGKISIILKHLRQCGTRSAIPVVERLTRHPDSTVRFAAKSTLNAISSH